MLEEIDLSNIQDENARQLIARLLNLIEAVSADLRDTQAENQRLRDENNRLKGEHGKPKFKANKPKRAQVDYSSEQERRESKPRHKRARNATIEVHREQTLTVDKASLPVDAEFKGYEDVLVQDVVFRADNVRFHKEKYWAHSTGETYLAPLPRGYEGQFGPGLKALTLTLYFGGNISEPKILDLYEDIGVQISAGQLSKLLIKNQEMFHAEKVAVCETGLESGPWQHTDQTSTRVDGQEQHCNILCNPLYTIYSTTPHKDRLSILDVLRNGRARRFRLNEEALSYLETVPLSKAMRRWLWGERSDQDWDESTFVERLDTHWPKLGGPQRQAILNGAAVAAYHVEEDVPIVRLLVCDDAPQYAGLTEAMAQCWVHEGRHYKKLMPVFVHHLDLLTDFRNQFWRFYDELLAYQRHPAPEESTRLEARFDELFSTCTGYEALDARIAKTREKKTPLLMVLKHPEIPLHNNPAELEARQRVRKRDVSFGPRTQDGVKAWDTFMSLAATATKLGISFYQYIHDRITQANRVPSLAALIAARASELRLGASWSVA
jgi:regulator of replication initiation timing